MYSAESVFGKNADTFLGMIDELGLPKKKVRYSFMDDDHYSKICREDPKRGMQIYWYEIIARTHLAAVTVILRGRHWISAVALAIDRKNLLSFAAAYRGFIESAADSSSTLANIPSILSRDYALVNRALSGQSNNQFVISSEMEDTLIHFSHARHLTKAERTKFPASHEAKKVRDYIEALEKGHVPQVTACYQSLCDYTHPGASSVWMWLTSKNGYDLDLRTGQDRAVIAGHLEVYRETFFDLLMFAFNPPIVTLNVLNYFPTREFHISKLLKCDLSGIPHWQKCQSSLAGAKPLASMELQSVKPRHGK